MEIMENNYWLEMEEIDGSIKASISALEVTENQGSHAIIPGGTEMSFHTFSRNASSMTITGKLISVTS